MRDAQINKVNEYLTVANVERNAANKFGTLPRGALVRQSSSQQACGRLLVAVRGANQHTRVRGHRLERTSKSTVSAVTMMMDNGVMNNYDGYPDGYMEQEEEWEREGLLDPAWEKQQKKVSSTHLMLTDWLRGLGKLKVRVFFEFTKNHRYNLIALG